MDMQTEILAGYLPFNELDAEGLQDLYSTRDERKANDFGGLAGRKYLVLTKDMRSEFYVHFRGLLGDDSESSVFPDKLKLKTLEHLINQAKEQRYLSVFGTPFPSSTHPKTISIS
jgi:hypothetical protein